MSIKRLTVVVACHRDVATLQTVDVTELIDADWVVTHPAVT